MKTFATAIALAAAFGFATSAHANAHKEAPTMQQTKMSACNEKPARPRATSARP